MTCLKSKEITESWNSFKSQIGVWDNDQSLNEVASHIHFLLNVPGTLLIKEVTATNTIVKDFKMMMNTEDWSTSQSPANNVNQIIIKDNALNVQYIIKMQHLCYCNFWYRTISGSKYPLSQNKNCQNIFI